MAFYFESRIFGPPCIYSWNIKLWKQQSYLSKLKQYMLLYYKINHWCNDLKKLPNWLHWKRMFMH